MGVVTFPALPVAEPKFCIECQQPLTRVDDAKFVCPQGHKHYLNPVPVGLGIIPIVDGGFVLGRRAINPGKGKWSFAGGNINVTEDIMVGIAREVEEEIGFISAPADWRPYTFMSVPDNRQVLNFAVYREAVPADYSWQLGKEVSEIMIAHTVPSDMAFTRHEEVLRGLLLQD